MLGESKLFCPYDSEAFLWNTQIPFIWRSRKRWGRSKRKDCKIWDTSLLLPVKMCWTRGWGQRPRFWNVESHKGILGWQENGQGVWVWSWTKERKGAKCDRSGRGLGQIDLGLPKWVFGDMQLGEAGCLGKGPEIGRAWGVLGDTVWGWDHGSWDSAQALSRGVSLHDHPLLFHSIPVSFIVQKGSLPEILQFCLVKESLVCRMLISPLYLCIYFA